ncbi:MAG: hypothetical protein ACW99G_24530 [Candidatus Thorarchaeota archaeon]|jgi:hypothetical protein
MNFIQLSRACDKYARQDGYDNFPDDLLSLILDYDGCNDNKPRKNIWAINFLYKKKYLFSSTIDTIIWGNSSIECMTLFYCDICDKIYLKMPSKNHNKTKGHKNNKLCNPDGKDERLVEQEVIQWFQEFNKNDPYFYTDFKKFKWYDVGLMIKK